MSNDATLAHILIVDDIPAISKIAGLVLRKTQQYRVSFAASGAEALQQVEEDTPDLILLDVEMPEMNGYAVCKQLKQKSRYRDIPIIFLTAMDSTNDTVTGFKAGGADYITKPFVPAILLARVDTHLNLFFSQRRERAMKRYLQGILTSMNGGLIVVDSQGLIQEVNPKLEQLCGKPHSILNGHPIHSLFSDEINTDKPLTDCMLLHHSGELIPVRVLSASLTATAGESASQEGSSVLLINDIRELLSAESSRQASQAKDDFLASMSHELRTPLASIIGNSELLQQRLNNPEELTLAQQIEVAGRNQLALIRDVLEVSKIEGGSVVIEQSPFDLTTVIQEMEQRFSHQAEQSGLSLSTTLKEMPDHQLLGDAPRLKQILHSLLSNALKFTEHGSIQLTVWSDAEQIYIAVEDNGFGITEETISLLFQRFQQADNSISRKFGGSGLGLYIANNLARLMGGSIEVQSTLQQGSTFQLNLPYRPSEIPVHTAISATTTDYSNSTAQYFHGRVLIAEDTPEMWMLVEAILQSAGIETTVAKNGQEALEIALSDPFDLILMDMQMPVMDGIEATAMLRQVGYMQPIAALTANVMQEHREQFEQAGCDAFLNKPIDRQALLEVLRRYLQPAEAGEHPSQEVTEELEISDELRQIFMDRLTTMAPSLQSALRYEQWDEIRSVAHNIKGSGSSFGYPEMTQMGATVCNAIDQQQFDQVVALAEPLLERINQAIAAT